MFQHMREEEGEVHDAVVLGAAPISHTPVCLPPSDHLDREGSVEPGEYDTSTAEDQVHATSILCNVCFYFITFPIIQSVQDVDMYGRWQKYEALMSVLSQSLCEELRLVLLPTQAAQLRLLEHIIIYV